MPLLKTLWRSPNAPGRLSLAIAVAVALGVAVGAPAGVDTASAGTTSAQPVLNELKINAPSADNPWEYVELRAEPSSSLPAGTYFVSMEGDGSAAGAADMVVSLGGATVGTNGLLFIGSPTGGHAIPAATTKVTDAQLDNSGGGLENGTNSFLLVHSPTTAIVETTDYDTNNDGVLELPSGASLLDAVGWTDGTSGDIVYGGVTLAQSSGTPWAATRFVDDTTPLSFDAWFNGGLAGVSSDSVTYDPNYLSANFPANGMLTPGDINSSPQVVLSLVPSVSVADPGDTVDVELYVSTTVELRTMQFSLAFDPEAFEGVSFTEGTFFSDWATPRGGSTDVIPDPAPIDNAVGKVGITSVTIFGGGEGGPTGMGLVGTFRLAAKDGGQGLVSPLALQDVVVGDALLEEVDDVSLLDAEAQVGGVRLSLVPSVDAADPGDLVDVTVVVTSTVELRTMQFSMTFDPIVVEALDFDEGTFFSDWATPRGGGTQVVPDPAPVDNVNGKIGITSVTITGGGVGGASGSGAVGTFQVRIRPTAAGQVTALSLDDVVVGDENSNAVDDVVLVDTEVEVAGPTVRLSLVPSTQLAGTGDTLSVDLVVNASVELRTMQFSLLFDPAVLQGVSFTEGTFFSDWATPRGGSTDVIPDPIPVDNSGGRIGIGSVTVFGGGEGGATGTGVVGTFQLTVLPSTKGLITPLALGDVVVGDALLNEVTPVGLDDASVQVEGVRLSLIPSTQTADPGDTVDVDLVVTTTVELRTMQFSVAFDPVVIEALGFDEGTFFSDWATPRGGSTEVLPDPVPIDNVAGLIGIGSVTIFGGGEGGPTGSGVVGTFRLKVKPEAAGQVSLLDLGDVVVGDALLAEVPDVAVIDGQVEVTGPSVRLSLVPTAQVADPGDTVDVDLVVNAGVELRTMQFSLLFDPAVLQGVSFTEGTFFSDWATPRGGSTNVVPDPVPVDNVGGRIGIGSVTIFGGGEGGPKGTGVVGTFQLTLQPDTRGLITPLSLGDVVVGDALLNEVTPVGLEPATVQGAGVRLSLVPSTQTADPGDTVDVSLVVTTTVELRTMQFSVAFDPVVIEALGFDEGTFFSDWATPRGGSTEVLPDPVPIDNVAGLIGIGSVTIFGGGEGGPTGSGVVGTFRLKVKPEAAGQVTPLALGDVVVGDALLAEVPDVALVDGQVEVTGPSVRLSLVPITQVADPGDTVDVDLVVNSGVELRTMQFSLLFDPTVLQGVSFTEGTFFSDWATPRGGSTNVVPDPVPIDNVGGRIGIGSVTVFGGGEGGAKGTGVVGTFRLTVQPDTKGLVTPLSLDDVVVGDALLNEVTPVGLEPATVQVSGVRLSLVPSTQTAAPGDMVDVSLVVTTSVELRTMQFSVGFDPDVIEALGFDEGTFFSDWATPRGGNTEVLPDPVPIDNMGGKIGIGSVTIFGGGEGGPTGSGVVGTFRLKVKPEAIRQLTVLDLGDVVVGDALLNEVPGVVVVDGAVDVLGPNVRLSLVPATQLAAPGDTVDVDLVVNAAVEIRTMQFSLQFDPEVLQGVSFTEGTFFSDWATPRGGSTDVIPDPVPVDNVGGQIGIGSVTVFGAGEGGPKGSGVVGTFRLTVRPDTQGLITPLSLSDVVVGDALLNEVSPVATADATVQVAGVRLSLIPNYQVADRGDAVDVTLVVTSSVELRTMQFSLGFDPDVLEATGFSEGTFFSDWATPRGGSTDVIPDPVPIDNVGGKIGIGSVTVFGGGEGGASGSGIVGTFHLTAKPGSGVDLTQLVLDDVVVGDALLNEVPGVVLVDAEAVIPSAIPGDCNVDTVVDAGDISAMVLEIFDGDGSMPRKAPLGTFPGHPLGCNANEDVTIDAGDISCAILLIFGGPGACTP